MTTSTTSGGTTTYKANKFVYGLHFMNSTINMNSIVNAKNISILGKQSTNHQLPVNCVDFNLKQKGVINFFAGTYFSGNNSFFSLHQVFRNDDAVGYNEENGTYASYNTISNIKLKLPTTSFINTQM